MGVLKGTKLPHLTGKNACHWRGGEINKECLFCKISFPVPPYRKDAKFCSRSCLAKSFKGRVAKNWRGGLSSVDKLLRGTIEYNNWRKAVYKRDNWTCQHCYIKQKHPVAHHVKTFKDFPELRFVVDNGLTLCRACHKKVHSEIGMNTQFGRVIFNNSLT